MCERSGLWLPTNPLQEETPASQNLDTPSQAHAIQREERRRGAKRRRKQGHLLELGLSTSYTTLPRPPALVDCSPYKTKEAINTFQNILSCVYTSKTLGSSQDDSMICNCTMESGQTIRSACLLLVPKFILIFNSRQPPERQYCMWGRRLRQSCDQDGVCQLLRVRR